MVPSPSPQSLLDRPPTQSVYLEFAYQEEVTVTAQDAARITQSYAKRSGGGRSSRGAFSVTLQSATAQDADPLNANQGDVDTEEPVTSRRLGIQLRMLSLFERSPGVVVAGFIAVLFAAAYLLAPPMGRDLAA
jgi:hypothetical protein